MCQCVGSVCIVDDSVCGLCVCCGCVNVWAVWVVNVWALCGLWMRECVDSMWVVDV